MLVGTPPRCLRSRQEVRRRPRRRTARAERACHGPLASGEASAFSEALLGRTLPPGGAI